MNKNNILQENDKVMTFDGILMPASKVRYIQNKKNEIGQYYIPNISCFKINNRWYPINSVSIALDLNTNTYNLKTKLIYGLISYINDESKFGYFSGSCLLFPLVYIQNQIYYALNEDILKTDFTEALSSGIFYLNKTIDSKSNFMFVKRVSPYIALNDEMPKYYGWDACPFVEDVMKYHENKVTSNQSCIEIKRLGRLIKNYTFGIEFETSNGTIAQNKLIESGLIPVRDGSLTLHGITPYEYCTIPLNGINGLQTILNATANLNKYCSFNEKCSLHLHIGNVRTDKLYLLAVFMAAFNIQQEIFELFPTYKKDPVRYIKSEKNYCQSLPSLAIVNNSLSKCKNKKEFEKLIDDYFIVLFKFMSGGTPPSSDFNTRALKHPRGDQKWNQTGRYYWINLMPIIFSNNRTIEMRISTPTFNPDKVINWLIFTIAFLNFCDVNSRKILNNKINITVEGVLRSFLLSNNKDLCEILISYFNGRKKQFTNEMLAGEYLSNSELNNDGLPIENSLFNSSKNFYEKFKIDAKVNEEISKLVKERNLLDPLRKKVADGFEHVHTAFINNVSIKKDPEIFYSYLSDKPMIFYDKLLDKKEEKLKKVRPVNKKLSDKKNEF